MRALPMLLLFVTACASAPAPAPAAPAREQASDSSAVASSAPAPAPAPASASAPTPASAPAPPPGPLPTGGIVLIGEIASPPSFDPKATLDTLKPQLVACYNQARRSAPALRGKLKLRINVNEVGTVLMVDAEPGGSAADPALVACLGDAIKAAHFPKPAGMATVTAPLVFRP
jgi:hypothetical protein